MAKKSKAKAKNKGGRPRKTDELVIAKLVEGLKNDFTIEEACRYAGISHDTYYEECKRDPKFAEEMARAQDSPMVLAKSAFSTH